MSRISFPNSPSVNDTYTFSNKTYVWDGVRWNAQQTQGVISNLGNIDQYSYIPPQEGLHIPVVYENDVYRTTLPEVPDLTSFAASDDKIETEKDAVRFLRIVTLGGPTIEEIQELLELGSKRQWLVKQISSRFDPNNFFGEWDLTGKVKPAYRGGWFGKVGVAFSSPRINADTGGVREFPRFANPGDVYANRMMQTAFIRNTFTDNIKDFTNLVPNGGPIEGTINGVPGNSTHQIYIYDTDESAIRWEAYKYGGTGAGSILNYNILGYFTLPGPDVLDATFNAKIDELSANTSALKVNDAYYLEIATNDSEPYTLATAASSLIGTTTTGTTARIRLYVWNGTSFARTASSNNLFALCRTSVRTPSSSSDKYVSLTTDENALAAYNFEVSQSQVVDYGPLEQDKEYIVTFDWKTETPEYIDLYRYRFASTNGENRIVNNSTINLTTSSNLSVSGVEVASWGPVTITDPRLKDWNRFQLTFKAGAAGQNGQLGGNSTFHQFILGESFASAVPLIRAGAVPSKFLVRNFRFEELDVANSSLDIRNLPTSGLDDPPFIDNIDFRDPGATFLAKAVWVLSKHIPVSITGGGFASDTRALSLSAWNALLARNAFTNYADLLEDIAYNVNMANMLTHLSNIKGDGLRAPDENFAREIMQLFSIGLNALNIDGTNQLDTKGNLIENYSNDDIIELAGVFTGLTRWWFTNNEYIKVAPELPDLPNAKYPLTSAVLVDGVHYINLNNSSWYTAAETNRHRVIRSYYTLPPLDANGNDLTGFLRRRNASTGELSIESFSENRLFSGSANRHIVFNEEDGKIYVKHNGQWNESPDTTIQVVTAHPTLSSLPDYSVWYLDTGATNTAKSYSYKVTNDGTPQRLDCQSARTIDQLYSDKRTESDPFFGTRSQADYYDNYTQPNGIRYPRGVLPRLRHFEPWYETGAKTLLGGVINIPAWTDPQTNIRMAVESLIKHPSCAPFVSKSLIKLMVSSNPSPAYVERVARVFRDNGKGITGDMISVWTAIVTDPEASYCIDDNLNYGRIRDGYELWSNISRSLKATSFARLRNLTEEGKPQNESDTLYFNQKFVPGRNEGFLAPESGASAGPLFAALGAWPTRAPSVFSFYSPFFTAFPAVNWPKRFLLPELGSISSATMANIINRIDGYLTTNLLYTNTKYLATGRTEVTPNLTKALSNPYAPIAEIVDELDLLLCRGLLQEDKKKVIRELFPEGLSANQFTLTANSTTEINIGVGDIVSTPVATANAANTGGSILPNAWTTNLIFFDRLNQVEAYIHIPQINYTEETAKFTLDLSPVYNSNIANRVRISAQKIDNATPPATPHDIISWDRTVATVELQEIQAAPDSSPQNITVDITPIIRELIQDEELGFSSGNNVNLIVTPLLQSGFLAFRGTLPREELSGADLNYWPENNPTSANTVIPHIKTFDYSSNVSFVIESGLGPSMFPVNNNVILVKKDEDNYFIGILRNRSLYDNASGNITVQLVESEGVGNTFSSWEVTNISRNERRISGVVSRIIRTPEFWVM